MQVTPDTRQVLLVAAPNDTPASELITALRASGVDVLVANTIALAARADEFAVCIIILRPGQWRTTPVVTTAMRCNPRYMIPVLAEPMALPGGTWSTEAVNIKEPLSETVHELEMLINKQLQTSSEEAHIGQKQQTKGDLQRQKAAPFLRSTAYNRNRMRLNSIRKYVPIVLLLVLFSGILVYYVTHQKPASQSTNAPPGGSFISNSAFGQDYTVSVPGPGCNIKDNDSWTVGEYFKTLGTPTATAVNTNTSPKETPTPHVVVDNSTRTTCRQDGLYVQHTDHYSSFAEVFFQGNAQETLPQHFSTQVTATALNASNIASFTLGVRGQPSSEVSYDRGYGNDDLDVGVDGSWQTVRINDITDQEEKTFTRGYVKPSQTVTLGAEVDGPRITFSINGQKVTTIVDITYPNGYAIGFGLSDGNAKSAPSALYSNFSYKPLTNTSLTPQAAIATATAQVSANMQKAYTAAVPGFGCDQGSGQWEPVTKENSYATANCQPDGLALSQDASAKYNGFESFYGLDGNLPTNYNVQVQIDTSGLSNGCAGLMTRTDMRATGYNFLVCSNGYWQILRFDSNGGDGHRLADGFVNPRRSYAMLVTSQGDAQSLSLDGVTATTVHDSTLQTTDHIALTMYAGQGTAGTVIFSNFVFTPIF